MLSAHHRAASENVVTSGYYPSSPPAISPLSSFAAAQESLDEQPSQHTQQSHPGSGKVRRPSISSAINWLSNAPAIQHMKGPQSVVISAPSIDGVERFGELGKGATIVRTPAEALRQMGSNNSSAEFPSPHLQTSSRPMHSHAPSPSLPVNPMPLPTRDYFEEHSAYAPTRTNTSVSNHNGTPGSTKHKRTGSRAVVPTIPESELPPLPQSPMLIPRDGARSRGSSEARRSGGSGEDSGSARTSSSGGRRHAPAQSTGHLQAPPMRPANPPTPPNGSPMQMSLKLRDQDTASSRLVPFQGFSTAVPLTPSEYPQYATRRSPAPPALPMDLLLSPAPQPAFDAMVMAPLPTDLHKADTSKVIVILETSTASHKTTLQTLIARPSHLAAHVVGLYHSTATKVPTSTSAVTLSQKTKKSSRSSPSGDNEDVASVYSERSEFSDSDEENGVGFDAVARDHVNARRQKKSATKPTPPPPGPPVMHLFLDRPSAPYAHILSYLRTPSSPSFLSVPGSSDTPNPGMLPAAVRVFYPHNCSRSRLEVILDLRNEASYLGLTDLVELCTAELAFVGTASSMPPTPDLERTSLHSTHTLCEPSDDGSANGVGIIKKGLNMLFTKPALSPDPVVVPLDVGDAREKEREREKGRERELRAREREREREAERAQAALHVRRQNAGAKEYEDRSERYRFPASPPTSIMPVSRSDSLYYSRNAKSQSPGRGRRAGAPVAVKPPSGDYF